MCVCWFATNIFLKVAMYRCELLQKAEKAEKAEKTEKAEKAENACRVQARRCLL